MEQSCVPQIIHHLVMTELTGLCLWALEPRVQLRIVYLLLDISRYLNSTNPNGTPCLPASPPSPCFLSWSIKKSVSPSPFAILPLHPASNQASISLSSTASFLTHRPLSSVLTASGLVRTSQSFLLPLVSLMSSLAATYSRPTLQPHGSLFSPWTCSFLLPPRLCTCRLLYPEQWKQLLPFVWIIHIYFQVSVQLSLLW